MEAAETVNSIVTIAVTLGIGTIGFFLKRAFTLLDDCATKAEFKECENDVKDLSDNAVKKEAVAEIKARMDKLEGGIEFLKENSIRKDEFVRLFTRLENKIDRLS